MHIYGEDVTKENVGIYAGFLTSAFMIGRALSAVFWGNVGDRYGRKFVLNVSCVASAIGSIAFGFCNNSFAAAWTIRFMMGLGNGTMVMARTVISELSHGNSKLESKGVGLLMSMIGYGTLVAPAVGGCLSQPLLNYPQLANTLPVFVVETLKAFPFLLPNVAGCVLSVITLILITTTVPETLPKGQVRNWSHAGMDILDWLVSPWWCSQKSNNDELRQSFRASIIKGDVPQGTIAGEKTPLIIKDKNESTSFSAERGEDQKSITTSSNVRSGRTKTQEGSLTKNAKLIKVILTYWLYTLVSVAQAECFPLFAMSTIGGLAMGTSAIGMVGTLAGLVYVAGQYITFNLTMEKFGPLQTMRYGAFVAGTIVVLYPFGRYLACSPTTQIVVMGLVMGIDMVAGSVFMGANTIEVNKYVDAAQRGKVNGITSMGTSIGQALGPILAGVLTTFFMSPSTYSHPEMATRGGWLVYAVLLVIGVIAFWPTLLISDDDDDECIEKVEALAFEELEV